MKILIKIITFEFTPMACRNAWITYYVWKETILQKNPAASSNLTPDMGTEPGNDITLPFVQL